MAADLTLTLGLKPGRNANAAVVAEALAAWVLLVGEAAKAIDPLDPVVVELVGLEEGSLKLRQLLRRAEGIANDISAGADEYPTLKAIAIGMAAATATAAIGVGIEKVLEDPVQEVRLSKEDRELLQNQVAKVNDSVAVQHASRRFYQAIERDPAVTEIVVLEGPEDIPVVRVPREEFSDRGGLWQIEEEIVESERTTRDVWDVVLLKAPFLHKPRRWTFLRDGILFSARMDDAHFLRAIRDGRVPITLQEGVMMRIEVEFKERQKGQVWRALDSSRRVTRVVAPLPLPSPLPLAHSPKKD